MKTNCVSSNNCTHGAVSVLQDVVWFDQCSGDLSIVDDAVFSGQEWNYVLVYLDDILVASKSMSAHKEHMQKVLQ